MLSYFRYSQTTKYGIMETDYIITKVPLVTIEPNLCDIPCEKGHICTSGGNDVSSITLRDRFVEGLILIYC